MVAAGSKCRTCRGPAIIDLPRHNANFCAEHFMEMCRRQVVKAIDQFEMLGPDDRVLVAVSGGKDSLAVWDLLIELGYQADGLYVGLGIGDYSDTSGGYARRFAIERGLRLLEVDLRDDYGFDVPTAAAASRRAPCSSCGLSKRHLFDKAALDGGYTVLVTGHNLDDEAAVLFGNTLRWDVEYLARQLPSARRAQRLPEEGQAAGAPHRARDGGVVHRARHRLPRRRMPDGAGNQHLAYKAALNTIEASSPGSKASFYLNFVDNMAPLLVGKSLSDGLQLSGCSNCGAPTTGSVCAFCHLVETASAHVPVPVELVMKKGRGSR